MLAAFVKFLEENGLARLDVPGEGDEGLRNEFLIQRYAYVARLFGLPLRHEYTHYAGGGPGSPGLAEECEWLARHRAEYDAAGRALPPGFRAAEFLDAVRGRGKEWLDAAASLVAMAPRIPDREDLARQVEITRDGFTRESARGLLREAEGLGLLAAPGRPAARRGSGTPAPTASL